MNGGGKPWSRDLPIQKLVIEVFSIVLGVLLALAMNQWREARSNRNLAETALANVELELKSNRDLLVLLNENNAKALEVIEDPESEDEEVAGFVPGLQLQDVAWQTFLATGVSSLIDYQVILAVSETYSMQRVYKEFGSQMVQAEMSSEGYAAAMGTTIDDRQKVEHLFGYLQLLVSIEMQLMKSYDASLAVLE